MTKSSHFELLIAGDGTETIVTKKFTTINRKKAYLALAGVFGVSMIVGGALGVSGHLPEWFSLRERNITYSDTALNRPVPSENNTVPTQ
jgi:hypothetical protein